MKCLVRSGLVVALAACNSSAAPIRSDPDASVLEDACLAAAKACNGPVMFRAMFGALPASLTLPTIEEARD